MSEITTTKLTPKVQHPERTKKFVSSIEEALDHFEDQIGSLDETIRTNAYKMLLNSYTHLEPSKICRCQDNFKDNSRQRNDVPYRYGQKTATTASYSKGLQGKTQSP